MTGVPTLLDAVATTAATALARASAPLDPSGDEARRLLRRELARPAYVTDDPVQRLLDTLSRLIEDGVDAARGAPPLSAAAAVLATLLIVTGLVLLASRARRSAVVRPSSAPVLDADLPSAAELRARAESALAAGSPDEALVDAYRAAALRQIERGRVPDLPQATALEVARSLAAVFTDEAAALHEAAGLFDAVLYGDRRASVAQARAVLDLDDRLARARVTTVAP